MAKVDDKLMAFVEDELKKDPDAGSKDLFEKAKKSHAAARDLTIRQFHARYPLQVKRKASLASSPSRPKRRRKTRAPAASTRSRSRKSAPAAPSGTRDAVRGTLLKFAADLTAAEERKALVKVLARVDDYVDEILSATA